MKTTTVTEAKAQLSMLLKRVRRGETILILHRGRPAARLEPVRSEDRAMDRGRLQRLERAGVVRRASEPPDPSLLDHPAPRLSSRGGLLAALLEERKEQR